MIAEEWRDIEEYESYYQISDKGNVKSLARVVIGSNGRSLSVRERILKQNTDKMGYKYVILQKNGEKITKKVHRLVGEAFLSNENSLPQINHLDGTRDNNLLYNLEWVTPKENQDHRHKLKTHGSKPNLPRGITWRALKNKWSARIKVNRKTINIGYFQEKQDAYSAYFNKFIEIYGYEPWDLKEHKTHE